MAALLSREKLAILLSSVPVAVRLIQYSLFDIRIVKVIHIHHRRTQEDAKKIIYYQYHCLVKTWP